MSICQNPLEPTTSGRTSVPSEPPLSLDRLTVEWLQATMAPHLGGALITGFSPSLIGVGEGFMGQLARLALEYEDEGAGPRSLIAKFASPRADTREMARSQNLYQREIGFYQCLGARAGVPVPHCYFSHLVESSYEFVMLLEDLAPGKASDQVAGSDRETSREVIEQAAKLHAKWWNSEELDGWDWARWIFKAVPVAEGIAQLEQSIAAADATGCFDAYPEMKRLMPALRPLFRIEPQPPYPFTLTHGDLRSDNIITPTADGGRFAIIDWQLAGKGDPMNDIVRWLVQSISIQDRRETEQALLKRYHAALVEQGVRGYSYRQLINSYKLNLVVVLIMFSMSMETVDQSSARAKALFHEFYSRLDAALVDWQIDKFLRVLPYLVPFLNLSNWLKAKLKQG